MQIHKTSYGYIIGNSLDSILWLENKEENYYTDEDDSILLLRPVHSLFLLGDCSDAILMNKMSELSHLRPADKLILIEMADK